MRPEAETGVITPSRTWGPRPLWYLLSTAAVTAAVIAAGGMWYGGRVRLLFAAVAGVYLATALSPWRNHAAKTIRDYRTVVIVAAAGLTLIPWVTAALLIVSWAPDAPLALALLAPAYGSVIFGPLAMLGSILISDVRTERHTVALGNIYSLVAACCVGLAASNVWLAALLIAR